MGYAHTYIESRVEDLPCFTYLITNQPIVFLDSYLLKKMQLIYEIMNLSLTKAHVLYALIAQDPLLNGSNQLSYESMSLYHQDRSPSL